MHSERRFFLIAGEASGDMHGAALIEALRRRIPNARFRGMGGEQMRAAGMELVRTYHSVNVMGFVEVVKRLPHIWRVMNLLRRKIVDYRPDALILIDFPGFNLRMARWAHGQGIPVAYYILPQVWAWHSARAWRIGRWVDLPLAILPFEPSFYQQYGVKARYVGHPLVERIRRYRPSHPPDDRNALVIMPGSRPQEIRHVLPDVLEGTKAFHEAGRTLVVKAPAVPADAYWPHLARYPKATLFEGHPYEALAQAGAAVVTSGTATLETALWDVPQVVVYRGNRWSYRLAKALVKVPFISLVNLIVGRKVVEELIQDALTPAAVHRAVVELRDSERRRRIAQGYAELRAALGSGSASETAAATLDDWLARRT